MIGRKRPALESPLELVATYDKAAQDSAWEILREKFDHSPGTIPMVESILDGLHGEYQRRDFRSRIGLGPNETDAEQWANLWGIYIGETLRLMFGGKWIIGHQEAPNLLALEFPDGTVTFPTARAFRRISEGADQGIPAYVELLSTEMNKPDDFPDPTAASPDFPLA